MRKHRDLFAAAAIIIAGMILIAYPYISEALFEHRANSEINTYKAEISELDDIDAAAMLQAAADYNEALQSAQVQLTDPFIEPAGNHTVDGYERLLSADDSGIMGYVEIPAIDVYLPIYHGTSALILERGAGHLEGTSLPVGGKGTHAVLTGHTGLNKARLFTDLTEVRKGDTFFIHILGKDMAYQVYDTEVVLPENTENLIIFSDEDLVTLVTCTPYGSNTHRLLVHGRRTEYTESGYDGAMQAGDSSPASQWMTSYKKAICIGMVIVGIAGGMISITGRICQHRKEQDGQKR